MKSRHQFKLGKFKSNLEVGKLYSSFGHDFLFVFYTEHDAASINASMTTTEFSAQWWIKDSHLIMNSFIYPQEIFMVLGKRDRVGKYGHKRAHVLVGERIGWINIEHWMRFKTYE